MYKMRISHSQTSVFLIGEGLRQMSRLLNTLNSVGVQILFADEMAEAVRTMCFGEPDFVLCEMELPDGPGTELCRIMRANKSLCRIPVVLVSRSERGVACMFDALSAGADDLLAEDFDPNQFLAKLIWLIERRNYEEARKQHLAALKERQNQTLEIVRETSELLNSLANERKRQLSGRPDEEAQAFSVDQRLEMGLSMIGGLANIIDEQVEAISLWEAPAAITEGLRESLTHVYAETARR